MSVAIAVVIGVERGKNINFEIYWSTNAAS